MTFNLGLDNNDLVNDDELTTTSTITKTVTSTIQTVFSEIMTTTHAGTTTAMAQLTTTSTDSSTPPALASNLHITLTSREISHGGLAAAVIVPILLLSIILFTLGYWFWRRGRRVAQEVAHDDDIELNKNHTGTSTRLEEKSELGDGDDDDDDDDETDRQSFNDFHSAIPQIMSFQPALSVNQLNTPPIEIKELFKRDSIVPEIEPCHASQSVPRRSYKRPIPLPDKQTISNLRTQTRHR